MPEKKVHLRIVTPEEVKVDEKADLVIMRCTTGDLGIMVGHEPRSAVLDYGVLRILDDDAERRLAVFGGIAEVKDDVVTILTSIAERPEDIDRALAEEDRENAELRLENAEDDIEIQSSQVLLRRSLVRIEVSSYPILRKSD